MATKTSTSNKPVHAASYGNASHFTDSVALVAGDVAAAGVIQLVKVAAGTLVDRVVVGTPILDSNATPLLTAKIGFTNVDGSAAPAGADVAVAATAAWGRTAAAITTYEVMPPYRVEKDSWLTFVVGAGAATAGSGTLNAKVEGESAGVR